MQGCPGPPWPQVPVVTPFTVCNVHWYPVSQSASILQLGAHATPVQREGEQSMIPGSRQVPWPSQVRGVFSIRPEQEDGPHTVFSGYRVHEPRPSQRPLLPQAVGSVALHAESCQRAGRAVQVPTDPVWLHDEQASPHAVSQHTPSTPALAPTQKVERQSSPLRQTAPLILCPHLPATHCTPAAHWELVVQVLVQLPVAGSQVQGGQGGGEPGSEQLPLPSQVRTPVMPSPLQMPALHGVPSPYLWQPPLPSQNPSCPQVAGVLAVQTEGSLGFWSDGTKSHSPSELARLQALQVCPQAEVQQSPSAQNNPVWHSALQLQDSALPLDALTVPGGQVPGGATSDTLASFFPPSDAPPAPPEKLALVQPAAPKTAHKARAPPKAVPPPCDDVDP